MEGGVHGFAPESRERVEAALGPFRIVAEAGGETVGFISGSVHTSDGTAVIPAGESYLEIDDLYVSMEFRQRGIGGSLVDRLLAEARRQGVAYASLYSAIMDVRSVLGFYEQHGFQSWYVRMFRKL